jgi:multiple sugar transport system substrate-binding protein
MKTRLVCSLLTLTLLVTACTSTPAPQHDLDNSEPTVVRFAVEDRDEASYLELATKFEEENPDISIQIVSLTKELGPQSQWPDDYPRRIAQLADTMYHQIPARFQGQDFFLDLKSFIESDRGFNQDDFFPGALTTDATGHIVRLPGPLYLWGILYDKDILDAANLPYPQPGWTKVEFLQMAQRLTYVSADDPDDRRYGFLPQQRHTRYWLLAEAGDILEADVPPRVNLTDSQMVAALEWYANLFLIHQVAPVLEDLDFSSRWQTERDLIDAHKVAMWGGLSSDMDDFELSSRDLGFVPYPQSSGTNRYFEYKGYMISAGTQHPQEAWRWISWLSYQDVPPLGVLYSPNNLPPRRSVAEASGVWERLHPDVSAAFRWVFDNVNTFSPPLDDRLGDASLARPVRQGLDMALATALVDQEPAKSALADAQAQVMDQLAAVVRQQVNLDAQPIVVQEPKPKPTLAEGGIEIDFLVSHEMEPYPLLAKDFQREHPEIVVNVELHAPSQTVFLWPRHESMARRAPCFEGDWYIDMVDQQVLLDLTPLIDSDPNLSSEDFFEVSRQFLFRDGRVLGLPAWVEVYLIAYNRDLFDGLGQPYPPLDWDWEDFLRFSRPLVEQNRVDTRYAYVALNEGTILGSIIKWHSADLWEPGDRPQPRFNDPQVVAAVQWYVDLHRAHGIKPQYSVSRPTYEEMQEADQLVLSGRVAMWESTITFPPNERPTFDIGYTVYPAEQQGSPGFFGYGAAYFISSQATSEEIQGCWTWITYLSKHFVPLRNENVPAWGYVVPARRQVATSNDYRIRVGEDRHAAAMHTLDRFRPSEDPINVDNLRDYFRMWIPTDWFYQAVDSMAQGEEADSALASAQAKAIDYLACFDSADSEAEPRQAALDCARQVDPDYEVWGDE